MPQNANDTENIFIIFLQFPVPIYVTPRFEYQVVDGVQFVGTTLQY